MLSERNKTLMEQHFVELTQKFPDFICKVKDGNEVLEGMLPFRVTYNGNQIEDEYAVEITIPEGYPESCPIATETLGKIPDSFHRNKHIDNSLCLGSPLAIMKKFKENPTLLHFVEQQLVPFLFSHSYHKKYNEMPYGELSHGGEGILEYYKSYFDITDGIAIIGLLRILADNDYRGHIQCPCGSQNKLRKCHGKLLLGLVNNYATKILLYEYREVLSCLIDSNMRIPKEYLSITIAKELWKIKNAKK